MNDARFVRTPRSKRAKMAGLGGALLAALVALPAATAAAAGKSGGAEENGVFRWSAEVEAPSVDRTTLAALELQSPVLTELRPDYADLRLRDRQGRPVAFVLRRAPSATGEKVEKSWTAVDLTATPKPPAGLEITFAPPKRMTDPVEAIRIDTPLKDFEQQVQVFASADGETWRAVSPPTPIFDYARLVDVRNVKVPIEPTTDRHFRLAIASVTAEQAATLKQLQRRFDAGREVERTERTLLDERPFRVDRILLCRDEPRHEPKEWKAAVYPTSDFRGVEDRKQRETRLEFAAPGEPASEVRLLTDDQNFSRPVVLQVLQPERGDDVWRTVGQGKLVQLAVGRLARNELTLKFCEQRAERYRLVIENGDSAPLAIRGVELSGPAYEIVFLATPGESLRLEYGCPVAKPASYDTAAIDAALAAGFKPQPVALAKAVKNPAADEAPRWTWNTLFGNAWFVTCAIGGLATLLARLLYLAARRVDGAAPPDSTI